MTLWYYIITDKDICNVFYVQIAEKDAECYSGRRDGKPYVLRSPSSVQSVCYAKISSCLQ